MNAFRTTGRCSCGSIEFTLTERPTSACHCHCVSCRRASGAPFMTWVTFPRTSFDITRGRIAERESSPGVRRGHCADCGMSITYLHADRLDEIDISAVSLDAPELVEPAAHIWVEDKAPWYEISDDLPRYPQWRTQAQSE